MAVPPAEAGALPRAQPAHSGRQRKGPVRRDAARRGARGSGSRKPEWVPRRVSLPALSQGPGGSAHLGGATSSLTHTPSRLRCTPQVPRAGRGGTGAPGGPPRQDQLSPRPSPCLSPRRPHRSGVSFLRLSPTLAPCSRKLSAVPGASGASSPSLPGSKGTRPHHL